MPRIDLAASAATLEHAWRSKVIGRPAGIHLKVVRMDGQAYPAETHPLRKRCWCWKGR